MAGMILAAPYMTKVRYASDIMTDGVIVMIAAIKKLNAEWMALGTFERACSRVEYDAIRIGGRGGKSGSGGGMAAVDSAAGR